MKKFLIAILVIAIIVAVGYMFIELKVDNDVPPVDPSTGTTTPTTPNVPETNPITSDTKAKKTIEILSSGNYYMKYITDAEDMNGNPLKNVIAEFSVNGDEFAMDIPVAGYGIISKDDITYNLMHESKTYIKMEMNQEEQSMNMFESFENDSQTLTNSGEKEVDGTKYSFETYTTANESTTMYFDKDNNLKYIETTANNETSMIKIVELSKPSKSSMFNLPTGYTEITF